MPPRWGGGAPKCGRCSISVYPAEERLGAGKSWHSRCFTCKDCNKSLDATNIGERKDPGDNPAVAEVYCKSCYGKNFGPKGYGYGAGAGTLSMDAGTKGWAKNNAPQQFNSHITTANSYGAGPKCPRCGGSVYPAEEMVAGGQSWHRSCFKCLECSKWLDSTTVQDKEGEIYCKACYAKFFAPKGFGFGTGAGSFAYTE